MCVCVVCEGGGGKGFHLEGRPGREERERKSKRRNRRVKRKGVRDARVSNSVGVKIRGLYE